MIAALLLAGCSYNAQNNGVSSPEQITDSVVESGNMPLLNAGIVPFIDVSKGMSGYYAGQSATQFKVDVWGVLSSLNSKWNADSIMLMSENNPRMVDITSFREKMNAGKLLYDDNTSIPQMINRIVTQIDSTNGMVAVLISDMKYSPIGNKAPQALMAQYATDISNIFTKKELAVSLICAVSDYKTKRHSCDKSPYYYFIIGNPRLLPVVRNEIVDILKSSDNYIDEVEKNVDYGDKLIVKHIKAKGVMPLDKGNLVYGGYDKRVTDTIAITLGLDLSPYPHFLWKKDTLTSYLSATTSGLAHCFISDVETSDNVASFTIKICKFNEKNQDITISLGGYSPSIPREIEHYYGAERESDCAKTLSIDQFIRGIKDHRNIQSSVRISITTEDKK